MDAWKNAFFLQEKPIFSIKFLVLGGGAYFGFFVGGGGECRFFLNGRGDFSETQSLLCQHCDRAIQQQNPRSLPAKPSTRPLSSGNFSRGDFNLGERHSRVTRDDGTVTLSAPCAPPRYFLDERQITHLICARLKYDLYDFFRGSFGAFYTRKRAGSRPKTALKKSYRSYFRRAQIR